MTGATLNLNSDTSTNAAFRAWGSAISAAFTTLGFTKSADTGQIDWTTVAAPGATNTAMGYEIRYLNDSLHATRPVYAKVEYGSNTAGVNTPQMWLTIGTGTDGAGTLNGTAGGFGTALSTRTTLNNNSSTITPATVPCYLGNTGGSAIGGIFFANSGVPNGGWAFGIERMRNPDGTANNEGVMWWKSEPTGQNVACQQFVFTTGYAQQATQSSMMAPSFVVPAGLTMTLGTTLYPLPVFTGFTPKLQAPSKLVVSLFKGDLAVGNQFTMNHYGSPQTWVAAGPGNNSIVGWGQWAHSTVWSNSTHPSSFALNIT